MVPGVGAMENLNFTSLKMLLLKKFRENLGKVMEKEPMDFFQDLSFELLEQVRLLSNLETDQHKLPQIVLIGQPELRDRLERTELRQLRQRITVRYHLGPIDRQETVAYIQHRLLIAGSNGRPTFSRPAYRKIHRYARGVPRLINAVCDKALLCGYVEGRDRLGYWQIRRAVRELGGRMP